MEHTSRELVAASAEETRGLGARLGRVLAVGDVVALVGPLGSGKTTFAQGLAQGLEVPADRHVASPTFALVNQHPGRVPFLHADLYRIERPEELRELGLEAGYAEAASAVEWAGRFRGGVPRGGQGGGMGGPLPGGDPRRPPGDRVPADPRGRTPPHRSRHRSPE